MKLMNILSLCIILLLPLFLSNCSESSEPKPKQVLELVEAKISEPVDNDQDGFQSSFHVNFELSVNTGSKDVYAWLGIRFYDPQDTAKYYTYFPSTQITVESGSANNSWYINVSSDLGEDGYLPQAGYDLFLLISNNADPNDFNARIIEVTATDLSAFSNIPIEPTVTDIGITIFDAWFEGGTDNDLDGYNSEDILWVDVDEASDQGTDVYLGLSYRLSGTSTYTPIAATEAFTVTGNAAEDVVGLVVTDIMDFPHNIYDFRVDLMYDGWIIIEDTADPSTSPTLGSVQLETDAEDIAQTLSVYDAWWSRVQDNDLDSYYSEIDISIDADVSTGSAEVYFRIWAKSSTEQFYTDLGTTNPFTINGSSSSDDRTYTFYDFPHGFHDIRFELMFYGSSTVQVTYDDTDDAQLNNIPLELYSEDGL